MASYFDSKGGGSLRNFKKAIIGCLILSLLAAVMPMKAVFALEPEITLDVNQYVQLVNDGLLYDEQQQQVGVITAGTKLGIAGSNSDQIQFKIGNQPVSLSNSDITLLDSQFVPDYEQFLMDEPVTEVTEIRTLEQVEVYSDTSFNQALAILNSGQTVEAIEIAENAYEIIFSDQIAYIPISNKVTLVTEIKDSEVKQFAAAVQPATEKPVAELSGKTPSFTANDKFFKVVQNNVTAYINQSGKLVPVGYLNEGQVYPRLSDYGDWHKISFSDKEAFIWKAATEPSTGKNINNLAATSTSNSGYFTAMDNLTVYDNTSGSLIPFARLYKGVKYPYISDVGDWLKVSVGGRIGYIYKPAVKLDFKSTDQYFESTEKVVSVYDNRTGKLVHVGYLQKGQVYPRVSDYGDWHKIKYGDGYGFIWKDATKPANGKSIKNIDSGSKNTAKSFIATDTLTVYDNSSGQLVPFMSIFKGVQYPILSDYGDWFKISIAGRIGYVYKPATKIPFTANDKYFQVLENNVSIYDNSSGSLKHVGYLVKGESYPRISDYGDWHKIKYGRGFAFVWKDATSPANVTSVKNENKSYSLSDKNFLANDFITVYDNSSGSLVPFATISKGETYPFINYLSADWIRVDVSGRIGYVYRPAVQIGPVYLTTLYNYSFQSMVDKQFSVAPQTDKKYRTYVRSDSLAVNNPLDPTKGIVNDSGWRVRGGAGIDYWAVGTLNKGESVDILGSSVNAQGETWYEIKYNRTWVNASKEDTAYYLDPENFKPDSDAYFQFLVLSETTGVHVNEVNEKILVNKGILSNKGQTFIDAANQYKINEIYLISHALLETGNGSSLLAKGIVVDEVDGIKVPAKTVYNMFGIGAFDSESFKKRS